MVSLRAQNLEPKPSNQLESLSRWKDKAESSPWGWETKASTMSKNGKQAPACPCWLTLLASSTELAKGGLCLFKTWGWLCPREFTPR